MLRGMKRGSFLSLPNAISLSRVVLAAGFAAVPEAGARVALIGVASATDFLDGWVARRRGSVSRWGALIDPLADRAFVLTAVATYGWRGELSAGQSLTLVARDVATAAGFIVARFVPALRHAEFKARLLGKVVTALQLVTLFAVLLAPSAVSALVIAVGVLSVASIADYTLALWRARDA
jgi:CDP-diacylglycerol--glycerol-3-phosphate 3-phosphatidyltransferase/cardiolipin synthase